MLVSIRQEDQMSTINSDCVVLDIKTYNTIKNSEIKANLVVDRLFELIELDSVKSELTFKANDELLKLLQLAYPRRFQNKFDELYDRSLC